MLYTECPRRVLQLGVAIKAAIEVLSPVLEAPNAASDRSSTPASTPASKLTPSQPRRSPAPPASHCASGPCQVWSWDITWLKSPVRGLFYYLYLIIDLYSRKIVGWEVHENETADHAALLIRKACLAEGVHEAGLVLHADNGSPMKGATMLATLQRLGVVPSFSRPSTSNDNPFSEALFKTVKYRASFPDKPFESLQEAREWVAGFQHWYNEVHRHSALKFVTPAQRHRGEDTALLQQRHALYEAAKARRPERWSGPTRNWAPEKIVYLNPGKPMKEEADLKQKAA